MKFITASSSPLLLWENTLLLSLISDAGIKIPIYPFCTRYRIHCGNGSGGALHSKVSDDSGKAQQCSPSFFKCLIFALEMFSDPFLEPLHKSTIQMASALLLLTDFKELQYNILLCTSTFLLFNSFFFEVFVIFCKLTSSSTSFNDFLFMFICWDSSHIRIS